MAKVARPCRTPYPGRPEPAENQTPIPDAPAHAERSLLGRTDSMKMSRAGRLCFSLAAVALMSLPASPLRVVHGDDVGAANEVQKADPEASYYYYGPNGLYKE